MSDKETLARAIEDLAKKATPGPWSVSVGDDYHLAAAAYPAVKHPREVCKTYPDLAYMGNGTKDFGRSNADLICTLVNNLPTILSALRASTEGGEEIKKAIRAHREECWVQAIKAGQEGATASEILGALDKADADLFAALSSAPSIRDQVIEECARERLGAVLASLRERYEAEETTVGIGWAIARLEEVNRGFGSLSTKPTEAEGWVMVPKEPTEEMRQAGFDANGNGSWADTERCYRAMIEAAPLRPCQGRVRHEHPSI